MLNASNNQPPQSPTSYTNFSSLFSFSFSLNDSSSQPASNGHNLTSGVDIPPLLQPDSRTASVEND